MSLRSRNTHGHLAGAILCENVKDKCHRQKLGQPLEIERHRHKSHFQEFTRKTLCVRTGTSILRGPAQSKCVWTPRKSQFDSVREFCDPRAGQPFARVCAIEMHVKTLEQIVEEKCRAPAPRRQFCAMDMHMEMSKAILCENS